MKSSAVLAAAATLTTFASASTATRIACVGDSITAGSCSSGEPAFYPSQLQDLLDAEYGSGAYNVTNFGESGATMQKKGDSPYWERASFPKLVAETWDIVVIMLGTNDAKDEGSGGLVEEKHAMASARARKAAVARWWVGAEEALKRVARKDPTCVFHDPVDPRLIPGYHAAVEKPTHFCEIASSSPFCLT